MVRDREVESLRLTATDFESVVAAITPIPHIYLKPTSCLIAISSIGSWMMLSIPIPLLCRTDWLVRPTWHYSAFGAHSRSFKNTIHAYLICLTHVPNIMMAVHQTPFNRSCAFFKFSYIENIFQFSIKFTDTLTCSYLPPSITCTIIFTFSIIPYLILFVKHYFPYTNNQ